MIYISYRVARILRFVFQRSGRFSCGYGQTGIDIPIYSRQCLQEHFHAAITVSLSSIIFREVLYPG
ncbi:hypothetical protein C5S39_11565 [Candidatus Methanophagaceae archaeon]|nr:hypothetical protein C5S39_11565 [Methanophagales archaeon]